MPHHWRLAACPHCGADLEIYAQDPLRIPAQALILAARDVIIRLETEHRYVSQDSQLGLENAVAAMKEALATHA